jgi:sensor histidine kinase YesM
MTRKQFNKNLIKSLIVFAIGAAITTFISCSECETEDIIKIVIYSGLLWVVLWQGSEYSVYLGNLIVGWLENPPLRLFISIVLIFIMTLMGFTVVHFFSMHILWSIPVMTIWDRLSPDDFTEVMLVTFGINIIMHGRTFLLHWRQGAINYEKVKTEQLATQFENLKSQINPHFLFNSLNALSSLVYDDQKKAVEFIRKLSDVYRYLLDQTGKEVITLKEELQFVKSFIYLQKIRFSENLQVSIEIEDRCMERVVPPLSLQILVENAIKHNVISTKYTLTIEIKNEGIEFLSVKNTLKPRMHEESKGIGLKNLKQRYSLLSDREVYIRPGKEEFYVRIPLLELN